MLTIIASLFRKTFIVWAGLLCLGHGAFAGVSIVDDGSNGGPAKILIQSAIKKGDLIAFENALEKVERSAATRINDIPFVTVELNSPGGDVVEALGIGRAIYKNLAMTMVRPGKECVSACVFIFVAGAVRTPDEGASIGLHRPLLVSWTNISAAEAHARYNGLMNYLRDYFRELGISDRAFDILPIRTERPQPAGRKPALEAIFFKETDDRGGGKPSVQITDAPTQIVQTGRILPLSGFHARRLSSGDRLSGRDRPSDTQFYMGVAGRGETNARLARTRYPGFGKSYPSPRGFADAFLVADRLDRF
jgi:hypothetical protein